MMFLRRVSLWLAVAVPLSSCVAPIRVQETLPPPPVHVPVQANGKAFRETSQDDPAAAAALLLDGIRSCESRIASGDQTAVEDYNYLVSRLITQLERAGLEPWGGELEIRGSSGTWRLAGREPLNTNAATRILVPTDLLDFQGKYAPAERILRKGAGAPVIAMAPQKVDIKNHAVPLTEHYMNLTAVVRTAGGRATVELIDPFATESITLAGRSCPLAMDYSSTIAMALTRERIDKLGIARTLNPQKWAHTARLGFAQPYDAKRIPVLMVHGLQDTPATWMPMYLGLIQDPEIRERYQFWTFSYPSGYPFTYSAMLLRRELDRVRQLHPDHKDIVIIGHSMGGIISRLMITDAGERLWTDYFGKPPAASQLHGSNRALLEQTLIFKARDEISRAIFICAPHRGSELASNWVGRLASKLVRAPTLITDITTAANRILQIDPAAMELGHAPNSIDSLSPHSRAVRYSSKIPPRASIPFHSLIGDRGKGNTPDSSDGVVAYWSSHLDGAASEKIIPCGHSSHQHPEAIAEVKRILKLHAGRPK